MKGRPHNEGFFDSIGHVRLSPVAGHLVDDHPAADDLERKIDDDHDFANIVRLPPQPLDEPSRESGFVRGPEGE